VAEEKSPERKRIDRLYKIYGKAQQELDEFQAHHESIFERFSQIVNERNVALDQLKRGCRETGLSAGPLEVSVQRTRVFDGKRLWEIYRERKDLRNAIVTREYKVDTKAFDQLVQAGEITADVAQEVITEIKTTYKVLHSPPELVVG
jgi:hypothetical protein